MRGREEVTEKTATAGLGRRENDEILIPSTSSFHFWICLHCLYTLCLILIFHIELGLFRLLWLPGLS